MNKFLRINTLVLAIGFTLCIAAQVKAQTVLQDSLTLDTLTAFTTMEEALKHPQDVVKLELRHKKLKAVPPEILQFVNLQYLDISKNQITELPAEIGQLKNLQYLNVSKNKLEKLPPQIGELTNLYYLNIGQNDIFGLPNEIGKLEKLTNLDAWSNNLAVFPDELLNMKHLQVFDLRSIVISEKEEKRIRTMLPHTKIYFSSHCSCQN